ncbi:hypothetical protein [Lacisediminihabitans sp. H27-G8]|uniref:hypothetical protein n=1 Tax=Lacisediminihabitans sp. H27-G8 TaxID=3111909 RepID=UPI0038FCDD92
MRTKRILIIATAAAALLVAGAAAPAFAGSEGHGHDDPGHGSDRASLSFGVIGDVPYGAAEIAAFPSYVQDLNAHKELSFVGHVGDIKNGSSVCSDEYFASIRSNFDSFRLPLVYTPGDNEWTDCHRANNGAYNPLERLAAVRKTFFPRPGVTLGAPMRVDSQARSGFPENVDFRKNDISFTAVNIPGSDNSLLPWSGLGQTTPTPEQVAEVQARTQADIRQLTETFQDARRHHDRAVVVMTQADMFDPTGTDPAPSDYAAFTPLVKTLIEQANTFGGPVYLINGDSHVFNEDHPLASGSSWLTFYGQSTAATNLTRLTVDGSANAQDWLKATEAPRGATTPLIFERVPFTHPAS